jgi:transposase-like protein
MRITKTKRRRNFSADFKARVAIEAIKGQRTIQEIGAHYGAHPNQVTKWKRQALDVLPQVFADHRMQGNQTDEALVAELYQQIGQLKVQLDWLKKKSGLSE